MDQREGNVTPGAVSQAKGYRTDEGQAFYRGYLRLALLRCLRDGELHGLGMMELIRKNSGGQWTPSPGSIYPLLKEMERQDLLKQRRRGRSVLYSLTREGHEEYSILRERIGQQMPFINWLVHGKNEK